MKRQFCPIEEGLPYLRDVDLGSLGASCHHDLEVVEVGERLLSAGACLVSGLVEDAVDLVLKGLSQRVAGRRLELVVVGFLDHFYHITLQVYMYKFCEIFKLKFYRHVYCVYVQSWRGDAQR